MDIDAGNGSSSFAVKSKYFTSKSAMDESLSEFQEPKINCAGPKTTVKKNSKSRKAPKRPRGQKDIRTALRSKKNELESYSKDFDKVCKKAGIDVDPEQLQLAIALSRSLQDTASTSNESPEHSQTVNTQDRIGKIRTTLQEYGFKVPEVKIAGNNRKTRKHRTNFKLIQTSEIEKKETIANRYSQILFQNITHCSLYYSDIDASDTPIYSLASNVTYDILRLTDTFYVNSLIEKSTSTGYLLKDWSEIPGRPESPKLLEPTRMNFSEIECSQDELDIVLSGSLKHCKDIINKKTKDWFNSNQCKLGIKDKVGLINNKKAVDNVKNTLTVEPITTGNKYRSCSPDMFDEDVSDIFDNSKKFTVQKDNFPEVCKINTNLEVVDLTEPIADESQSEPDKTNRSSNDMELTECIKFKSQNQCATVDHQTTSQYSQKSNRTERRSNDLMELTECVAKSSQSIQNKIDLTQSPEIIEENSLKDNDAENVIKGINSKHSENYDIDLTKSPESQDNNEKGNNPEEVDPGKVVESMDLTQSSTTSDELPFVSLTAAKNKSLDDTVIVNIDDYVHNNNRISSQKEVETHIDLTQNIQKDDDASMNSQSFFDEYDHNHSDSPKKLQESASSFTKNDEILDKIDLTQCTERKSYNINNCLDEPRDNIEESNSLSLSQPRNAKDCSQIIIESPVECHPLNSPNKNHSKRNLIPSPNRQFDDNLRDKIDLTQKSDTSEELSQTSEHLADPKLKHNVLDASNNDPKVNDIPWVRNSQSCSSLNKDDVSIDYDEIMNNDKNNLLVYSEKPESIIYENPNENIEYISKNNSLLSNCSQNSEIFEISDKELDYSLHKSKLEIPANDFIFGCISVLDELSYLGTSKKSTETDSSNSIVNYEVETENYTLVNRKHKCNEISPIKHRRITEISTPQKASSSNMLIAITPKNSEMIIKTNNVTPIKDYESMSTPDLHKELDEFGIKPFKRKRAIQLLTHIYNETHPIIETAEDLASPPKRRKLNDDLPTTSKFISPRKLLTSPIKCSKDTDSNKNFANVDKENDIRKERDGNTRKGKGKGKSSLKNKDLEVSEKVCSINNENRSKEIVVNEAPVLKEIDCSPDDWVFQKREKAKVHSCRVPLHIAFYNYVVSRRDLREAILCYEPVEIDLIHKDLVGYGHRYDPKDLLKFLDKRCITVKTTDNDARCQKR